MLCRSAASNRRAGKYSRATPCPVKFKSQPRNPRVLLDDPHDYLFYAQSSSRKFCIMALMRLSVSRRAAKETQDIDSG